jgi:mRNA interferase RelE/StbE
MASYQVEFAKSAAKDLRSFDRQWIPKILDSIQALESDPWPNGCKKLVGAEHTYRVRIGDYRVIYDIRDNTLIVFVIRVRHRRDVYR